MAAGNGTKSNSAPDSSSSSDEDEEVKRKIFEAAVSTQSILENKAMASTTQQNRLGNSGQKRCGVVIPGNNLSNSCNSRANFERHRRKLEEPKDLQVSQEFQAHIAKHLANFLDRNLEKVHPQSCSSGISSPQDIKKKNSGIRLLSSSNKFVCVPEEENALSDTRANPSTLLGKPNPKRRYSDSSDTSISADEMERLSAAAVSGQSVLRAASAGVDTERERKKDIAHSENPTNNPKVGEERVPKKGTGGGTLENPTNNPKVVKEKVSKHGTGGGTLENPTNNRKVVKEKVPKHGTGGGTLENPTNNRKVVKEKVLKQGNGGGTSANHTNNPVSAKERDPKTSKDVSASEGKRRRKNKMKRKRERAKLDAT